MCIQLTMFVNKENARYTAWAPFPYRAKTTSRKVCALGARLFNSIANTANSNT